MKKINLPDAHRQALLMWGQSGGSGVSAVKELFALSIEDLSDISNIDSKGNVGLQTIAAQKAVEYLREMYGIMFPIGAPKMKVVPDQGKEAGSQWK